MTNSHKEFNKNIENGMKTFKFSNIQRSRKYNFKKEVYEFTLGQNKIARNVQRIMFTSKQN